MKFKQYNESFVFRNGTTDASKIQEFNGKKFKYTYSCGNAYERFYIEMFDGLKLNPIAKITDLNARPNTSAYINTETETLNRYTELCSNAEKYVKNLIS